MGVPDLFLEDRFEAKREFLKVFGAAFRLYANDGRLLAYSKQKAFRLKEDIRVYADEAQTHELLHIQADRVIDWSACYQVYDGETHEHYGSLRRKGWSSLFRDQWEILDHQGTQRGRVLEESAWKAFFRRLTEFAAFFMPQTFLIDVGGVIVGRMAQRFRWFTHEFDVDLTADEEGLLPRPLAIAAVILLLAVEGRQSSGG